MTEKFIESTDKGKDAKLSNILDKGNAFGALLTDLSKAFDCIDPIHILLIAKLFAF